MNLNEHVNKRNFLFFAFFIVALFMFYEPLKDLTKFSLHSMYYSHIWLVPLVSVFFLFTERKIIFNNLGYSVRAGLLFIIISILVYALGRRYHVSLNQNDYVSAVTFAAILFINGAFILCYGLRTFGAALFPLLFLIFMVPIPTFLLDRIIQVLLIGSTATTDLLFKITGAPYIREEATFHLPGISIEVANVCSGIRSSLALFITMAIAAHLFLKSNWKKVFLLLAIYPITVFKNGVRIVTISLLATYVDERFLTHSWLHHSGGIVFFIPALVLLGLILWALRRSDFSSDVNQEPNDGFEEE